jgi:hypothetical protein
MTGVLDFLSPDLATPDVPSAQAAWRSPLARALSHAPADVIDVSLTGKLEVRGPIDDLEPKGFEVIRITPDRALVLCDFTRTSPVREQLSGDFFVTDMSAVFAGLQLRGDTLMRRLTDLDLTDLPAVGAVAHVQAYVIRDEGESFRLFFPQEYGDYIVEVVIDTAEGIR